MGKTKRLFENEQEFQQQFQEFFEEPEYLTLDVRVQVQIPADELVRIPDRSILKKHIRKTMLSSFRKELTKELKRYLG